MQTKIDLYKSTYYHMILFYPIVLLFWRNKEMRLKKFLTALTLTGALILSACGSTNNTPDGKIKCGENSCDPRLETCNSGQCVKIEGKEKCGEDVCDTATHKCENNQCVKKVTAVCGDGKVEGDELCERTPTDGKTKCLTRSQCQNKASYCQKAVYTGTPNTCDATCTVEDITEANAQTSDGCCPDGADETTDIDCVKNAKLCSNNSDCAGSKYGEHCYKGPNAKKGFCVKSWQKGESDQACPTGYRRIEFNDNTIICGYDCDPYDSNKKCMPDFQCSVLTTTCEHAPHGTINLWHDCTDVNSCESKITGKVQTDCVPELALKDSIVNPGGSCSLFGCQLDSADSKCPPGSICYPLGGNITECTPLCIIGIDTCPDEGMCVPFIKDNDIIGRCLRPQKSCNENSDCELANKDNYEYECTQRTFDKKKYCYRKAKGSKTLGDTCTDTSQCSPGLWCEEGICTKTCTSQSDCGSVANLKCLQYYTTVNDKSMCLKYEKTGCTPGTKTTEKDVTACGSVPNDKTNTHEYKCTAIPEVGANPPKSVNVCELVKKQQ